LWHFTNTFKTAVPFKKTETRNILPKVKFPCNSRAQDFMIDLGKAIDIVDLKSILSHLKKTPFCSLKIISAIIRN